MGSVCGVWGALCEVAVKCGKSELWVVRFPAVCVV